SGESRTDWDLLILASLAQLGPIGSYPMSLSVCLLTRNEENNLSRALHSVAGLADEVLVVDTGSTDGTVRLAAELGASVHVVEWHDDFAERRNCALERARGDWLLWLNPAE